MKTWFKLDNAAKIYPPMITRHWSPMFRLSADLTEDIDPDILAQAQIKALKRFPTFATTLKKGLFWYYLEQIEGQPPILQDVNNPLQRLHFHRNNGFLYRILYYENRIAIEFFHSLTDGTGGFTFLMSLINEYLHLKYGTDIKTSQYILNCDDEPQPEEMEDAFLRYAKAKTISISEKSSYQYRSSGVPFDKMLIVSASVDSTKLRETAHNYDCSVGIFVISLLLYSVLQIQKNDKRRLAKRKPVKVSLPVNLRRFFPSKTLRNFSAFINPGLYGMLGDYTLEEVISYTKHFVALNTDTKELLAKFSYNVSAEKNILIRMTPLFFKVPILQMSYFLFGDMNYCSTLSNLGQINLPEEVAQYITRLDFMLGRQVEKRTMCGCISYNGKTIFNFTRTRLESDIERIFLSTLVEKGLDVFVESNGRI
ncbi:MAG: hypothetical protein IJM15_08105 [Erysipelotrichaceae bacterium]|nr:hypothetical protein [Erysipelotrichaceae bacterium]